MQIAAAWVPPMSRWLVAPATRRSFLELSSPECAGTRGSTRTLPSVVGARAGRDGAGVRRGLVGSRWLQQAGRPEGDARRAARESGLARHVFGRGALGGAHESPAHRADVGGG